MRLGLMRTAYILSVKSTLRNLNEYRTKNPSLSGKTIKRFLYYKEFISRYSFIYKAYRQKMATKTRRKREIDKIIIRFYTKIKRFIEYFLDKPYILALIKVTNQNLYSVPKL